MIAPSLAAPILALAFWDAWFALVARADSLETAGPLVLVAAALAAPVCARLLRSQALQPIPIAPLIALTMAYAIAAIWAPPLVRIAIAVIAILLTLHMAGGAGAPRAPFVGLVVLALPVLPSLEFYTAYPMRIVSAAITVRLLDVQGINAIQDGVALRVGERLFEFDAPCAGVRMLWAGCFLVSAAAFLHGFGWARYSATLIFAVIAMVFANAVRAASLVHVEGGALPIATGDWLHSGVGVTAFSMAAVAMLAVIESLARQRT
jgi:exosortase/archaeosortase family protein